MLHAGCIVHFGAADGDASPHRIAHAQHRRRGVARRRRARRRREVPRAAADLRPEQPVRRPAGGDGAGGGHGPHAAAAVALLALVPRRLVGGHGALRGRLRPRAAARQRPRGDRRRRDARALGAEAAVERAREPAAPGPPRAGPRAARARREAGKKVRRQGPQPRGRRPPPVRGRGPPRRDVRLRRAPLRHRRRAATAPTRGGAPRAQRPRAALRGSRAAGALRRRRGRRRAAPGGPRAFSLVFMRLRRGPSLA